MTRTWKSLHSINIGRGMTSPETLSKQMFVICQLSFIISSMEGSGYKACDTLTGSPIRRSIICVIDTPTNPC